MIWISKILDHHSASLGSSSPFLNIVWSANVSPPTQVFNHFTPLSRQFTGITWDYTTRNLTWSHSENIPYTLWTWTKYEIFSTRFVSLLRMRWRWNSVWKQPAKIIREWRSSILYVCAVIYTTWNIYTHLFHLHTSYSWNNILCRVVPYIQMKEPVYVGVYSLTETKGEGVLNTDMAYAQMRITLGP